MTPDELIAWVQEEYADKCIDLGGKKYLEAKWRIHALARQFPSAQVYTDFVTFTPDGNGAVVKARIVVNDERAPNGVRVVEDIAMHQATGLVKDYVANAATSAISRACAKLGIGTQFALQDFEEPEDQPVSDAPVAATPNVRQFPQRQQQPQQAAPQRQGGGLSERQGKMIYAIGMQEFDSDREAFSQWAGDTRRFTSQQASRVIEYLKNRQAEGVTGTGELEDIDTILSDEFNEAPF